MRTNPVTGWKSLFGAAHQVEHGWINDVTERESEILKAYCEDSSPATTVHSFSFRFSPPLLFERMLIPLVVLQLITENHDLQVRFRWGRNDLAIWDK